MSASLILLNAVCAVFFFQVERAFAGNHSSDVLFEPLVELLNNQQLIFEHWNDSDVAGSTLMTALIPWVTRSHPFPLSQTTNPVPLTRLSVDCKKPQYSGVLTGAELQNGPRVIIDFVPFGYDVDKLEIRFYELYDVVDAFVVYESPLTQKGSEKPMIYSLIKDQPRFQKFSDKVIHLIATHEELAQFKKQTESGMKSSKNMRDAWALEYSMRSEMIRKFNEYQSPLKTKLLVDMKNVYATQSDADEIPSGMVTFKYFIISIYSFALTVCSLIRS